MKTLQYTLPITALAETIAASLDDGEINLASAMFMQLGDTLATIAAVRALEASKKDPDKTR